MIRRSILVLFTVLVPLFTAQTRPASAYVPCEGDSDRRCVEIAAGGDTDLFSVIVASAPMHVLSSTGMGQEHFEAMMTEQVTVLGIPATGATDAPARQSNRAL